MALITQRYDGIAIKSGRGRNIFGKWTRFIYSKRHDYFISNIVVNSNQYNKTMTVELGVTKKHIVVYRISFYGKKTILNDFMFPKCIKKNTALYIRIADDIKKQEQYFFIATLFFDNT